MTGLKDGTPPLQKVPESAARGGHPQFRPLKSFFSRLRSSLSNRPSRRLLLRTGARPDAPPMLTMRRAMARSTVGRGGRGSSAVGGRGGWALWPATHRPPRAAARTPSDAADGRRLARGTR